ncbi:uncharacterized protein LOC129567258 [Sitodiplosis mosellana]|uniref:uncharacterized protein LOC129567258 n=1 Tax=Sitodiplosis mosellana TaxID=263140 RepID=UPI0024447AFF|nr:uncharacterized protein LOC129567258 [Sitodiplosis mosellana]
MNCLVIKFKNRDSRDISNKHLAEIYVKGPKFDIDLISTDQKVISAHKYVVCMFSGYLKDYIREFKPKGKACVPLSEVSSFVLKQVIDMFYNGQIMVGAEVKPHIVKALQLLKVTNVVVQNPDQQQAPKPLNNDQAPQLPLQTQPSFNPKPQMPTQHVNNRAPNMNQPRSIQPAMRQRAQSMYIERPLHGSVVNSSSPALPQFNGLPSHIGGVSIVKTKVAPKSTSPAMALLQNAQLSISRVQKPIQQQNIALVTPNVGAFAISKEVGSSDVNEECNANVGRGNMSTA